MVFNIFKKKEKQRERIDRLDIDKGTSLLKQEEEYARINEYIEKSEKKEETKKELPNFKKQLNEIENKINNKEIINIFKSIKDPELGIDIWNLELIYDANVSDNKIDIKMTFTSPMCPYGQYLLDELDRGLKNIGFEPSIEVVFNPLWEPSENVKEILGIS